MQNISVDTHTPSINLVVPGNSSYVLNAAIPSNYTCSDVTSGVATCVGLVANGASFDTASVGSKAFTVNATDVAGNPASATSNYSVLYASGGMCLGDLGHTILQPINLQGDSIFKQKSTVPTKFRVCDANGVSIGSPGVVVGYRVVGAAVGTVPVAYVEDPVSTTPDMAFRWSPTDQLWIFNTNTKGLTANVTYFYQIALNDGTAIEFHYGLK